MRVMKIYLLGILILLGGIVIAFLVYFLAGGNNTAIVLIGIAISLMCTFLFYLFRMPKAVAKNNADNVTKKITYYLLMPGALTTTVFLIWFIS